MSNYKLKVPVVSYHGIQLSTQDLIELLEQERQNLIGDKWDTIVNFRGKNVKYTWGHGSHKIGEEYSNEEVDTYTLEIHNSIKKLINYLERKQKIND